MAGGKHANGNLNGYDVPKEEGEEMETMGDNLHLLPGVWLSMPVPHPTEASSAWRRLLFRQIF